MIGKIPLTLPFLYNFDLAPFYLGPDGILKVRLAAFINTTGNPIHMEPAYAVTYQYEPVK
jgi:hypothetical protein